jgi:hypothetical protein
MNQNEDTKSVTNNNQPNCFKGNCNNCGKYGHKVADCISKANQNINTQSSGNSNSSNQGGHELNNANVELVLCQLDSAASMAVGVVQAIENCTCDVCGGKAVINENLKGDFLCSFCNDCMTVHNIAISGSQEVNRIDVEVFYDSLEKLDDSHNDMDSCSSSSH